MVLPPPEQAHLETRSISFVVVARNEVNNIARLKRSLDAMTSVQTVRKETVLIDNGSVDGTAELAKSLGFDLVIPCPDRSLPECRNRGIAEARGDWIAFIDADCEVSNDWLVQIAWWIGQREIILGWPVSPPEPSTWIQAAWHAHWMHKNRSISNLIGRSERGQEKAYHGKHPPVARSDVLPNTGIRSQAHRFITTANMVAPATLFRRLGGFETSLKTGEDQNLMFRAFQEGVEIVALPELSVVHHGEPSTLLDFFRQQLWHSNRLSFIRLIRDKGIRSFGNAILFTGASILALLLLLGGLAMSAVKGAMWLSLCVPYLILLLAPAVTIAWRAGRIRLIPQLMILYALYGIARILDILGLTSKKSSWRTKH